MRIDIFKNFTLKWWQAGLFKWGVLTLGIALGAIWYDFFGAYLPLLFGFAVSSLGYITYVWWKQ